jgi:IclR family acetate operon transcriptional repressor
VLQSPSALRIAAVPGERNPIHCTALGKSLLAYLPERELQTIVDKLPLIKLTPKTITHKKHLLEHLSRVREQGFAVDVEENVTGVVCVAAPIFDPEGRALASISISGPTARMGPKLAQVNEAVRSAAVTASRMLSPAAHAAASRSPKAPQKAS